MLVIKSPAAADRLRVWPVLWPTLWQLATCWMLAIALPAKANPTPTNPYYDRAKKHHTPDGFRNNYIAAIDKPLGELLRWRYEASRDRLPPAPTRATPVVTPELTRLHANSALSKTSPSVTWIGHATALVQAGGLNVLTDPIFSERASPVQLIGPKRAQPPGIALEDLPPIDVVVISHNHYDHLDRASVVALNAQAQGATLFLVPLGIKPWMEQLGISRVVELDWWDVHVHKGVAFHLTPVQHWSARSLNDRSRTLWGGWAVFGPGLHWYHSGDTGYSPDFADTRAHFRSRYGEHPFDLALLAIGAYEPRWFMQTQHINPDEAVRIHRDLGTRRSLGVHWGTFELTDEALDQPPRDLDVARRAHNLSEDDFFVLKIGQTRWLAPRADARP